MDAGSWRPLAEEEVRDLIDAARERMTTPQRRFWEIIRIPPAKWGQRPHSDQGGGFWAAAVIGGFVVWCNDIEDGFNLSRYSRYGVIDEYRCNQDQLEWIVERLLAISREGTSVRPRAGPPTPL